MSEAVANRVDPAEALNREEQILGYGPLEYVNFFSTVFKDTEGIEHTVELLVYRCPPREYGDVTMHQSRWVTYIDGKLSTGGTV